ncbi:arginine-tRNA-protein transferase [Daedaleopsis nitida]|nr:arginine-tRNA-protein transferase [Daedaleopsis nitida]
MSVNGPISILSPLRPHDSTCGYCSPPGERSVTKSSYHAAECMPMQLSCRIYQEMIDRGWRRSGKYCYKPDLRRSCCPQYTIKLGALEFKPSKSQRKLVNRWNRFVIHGEQKGEEETMDGTQGSSNHDTKSKGKGRAEHVFNLTDDVHASEASFVKDHTPAHRFEVILEPSTYTPEKFALYCSYQEQIHNDKDKSKNGFSRFLVHSPLVQQPIEYPDGRPPHLPATYGSYHQLYRLDGELIGMGVIDILPHCVSSVYFMYEKIWERFSFGKLSALREIALAKEIHDAGVPGMQYVYLGFYIHSCQKMRYKGDYSPSYLADPEEHTWHPLEQCRLLLDKNHYASFAHPDHSLVEPAPSAGMSEAGIQLSSTTVCSADEGSRPGPSRCRRGAGERALCRGGRAQHG